MLAGNKIPWEQSGEIIKVLGAVATAAAAWFAAITAYRGLEKWRGETRGRRRAELAASVLASVYECDAILSGARTPYILAQETVAPDGTEQKSFYAPERRLLEHEEFFGRFRSLKHEYAAVFGKEAAKPFDALWRIRLDINGAVHDMLNNEELGKSRKPDDIKEWRQWHGIAFRDADPSKDKMARRIASEVAAVEAICRPAIEAEQKSRD